MVVSPESALLQALSPPHTAIVRLSPSSYSLPFTITSPGQRGTALLSTLPYNQPSLYRSAPSARPLTIDWGHHTGTIDWCETNYSHSRYIAEFVNTLTNIPSISLGLYGLYHTRKNGIPLRYGLCFLGLSLIGLGSFGFHASLKWEWQLMDELPMVCHRVSRVGRSSVKEGGKADDRSI